MRLLILTSVILLTFGCCLSEAQCVPSENTVRIRYFVSKGDNAYDIATLNNNTLTWELDLDSVMADATEYPRLVYILHSKALTTKQMAQHLQKYLNWFVFIHDTCGQDVVVTP